MTHELSGSYAPDDVEFLLKPVTMATTEVVEKERLIQSGICHYSEMIGEEAIPDSDYMDLFHSAFKTNSKRMAVDLARLATALANRHPGGMVLASLARAGTPPGVILRRLLADRGAHSPHYSISIIRDRGVDTVAIDHLRDRHPHLPIVFIDGWTGKGTMARELRRYIAAYNTERGTAIDPGLVVVTDLCGEAALAATDEDYLIPSGILGGIVSGLVSRSILNNKVVGPGDFHACTVLDHLKPHDLSRWFVDTVTELARANRAEADRAPACGEFQASGRAAMVRLMALLSEHYGITDKGRIKPGIGEATRALLRRVPKAIVVCDIHAPHVRHLVHLAQKRSADVQEDRNLPCEAVALIQEVGS